MNLLKYKNIKFCLPRDAKYMFKLHKKLYFLCKRHGAILNLATSDINIFIENGSQKLIDKIKKMPNYYNSKEKFAGVDWEDKKRRIIVIW